jgi:hypothetical protein
VRRRSAAIPVRRVSPGRAFQCGRRRRGDACAEADHLVSPVGLASRRSRSVNASMSSVASNARLRRPDGGLLEDVCVDQPWYGLVDRLLAASDERCGAPNGHGGRTGSASTRRSSADRARTLPTRSRHELTVRRRSRRTAVRRIQIGLSLRRGVRTQPMRRRNSCGEGRGGYTRTLAITKSTTSTTRGDQASATTVIPAASRVSLAVSETPPTRSSPKTRSAAASRHHEPFRRLMSPVSHGRGVAVRRPPGRPSKANACLSALSRTRVRLW